MTFRFVPSLSDTDIQTYTYGEKPALRRRAHAIVLSHQSHTIDQICKILSVTRETASLWLTRLTSAIHKAHWPSFSAGKIGARRNCTISMSQALPSSPSCLTPGALSLSAILGKYQPTHIASA